MKKFFGFSILVSMALSVSLYSAKPVKAAETAQPKEEYYKIVSRDSGKVLDVSGFSNEDGGKVIQWQLHGGMNQQWKLVNTEGGYVKIVNGNSGKLLDIMDGSKADGKGVVQSTDKGSLSQQWKLVDAGGGYKNIVNRNSSKFLDVQNASTANGGTIIQQSNDGKTHQQWYLAPQTTGQITYTLVREKNPTADQADAYTQITKAMDSAVTYYNQLTNIKKNLTVYYNTSVSTADASINGTIRFGKSRSYMQTCTAMHEISHAVGVGQSSGWFSMVKNGTFNGTKAKAELSKITGIANDVLHADNMHFWPYGLNYASEVKTDADLINHCRIVNQMKNDGM